MKRPEYVCCILHVREDLKGQTWCGRRENPVDFCFTGVDHAATNGLNGGRLVACVRCAKAVIAALQNGSELEDYLKLLPPPPAPHGQGDEQMTKDERNERLKEAIDDVLGYDEDNDEDLTAYHRALSLVLSLQEEREEEQKLRDEVERLKSVPIAEGKQWAAAHRWVPPEQAQDLRERVAALSSEVAYLTSQLPGIDVLKAPFVEATKAASARAAEERARNEKLRELLGLIQWTSRSVEMLPECPVCGHSPQRGQGHADACELAEALR